MMSYVEYETSSMPMLMHILRNYRQVPLSREMQQPDRQAFGFSIHLSIQKKRIHKHTLNSVTFFPTK